MPIYTRVTARQRLAFILKGTIDATLAANLPADPIAGDTYKVTVAGDFQGSALIDPAGAYFDVGNYIVWNENAGTWDKIDTTENISDAAYSVSGWDGDTRNAPSKNATRDKFFDVDANVTHVSNELDTAETAVGLEANGTLSAFTDGYLSAQTSLKGACVTLSGALSAIQGEADAIETGAGLTSTGSLSAFSGTNSVDAATSLANAITLLDTYAKAAAIKYAVAFGA